MFETPILSDEYLQLVDELWTHYTQHGDVTLERQVIKIQEEVGEVAAALIGALGANPRKGFTHTTSDIAAELARRRHHRSPCHQDVPQGSE